MIAGLRPTQNVVAHKAVNKAAVVALVDAGSEFFQIGLKGEKMTHGEAP